MTVAQAIIALIMILVITSIVVYEGFNCLKPQYEPNLWNDDGIIQQSSNCMTYAFQESNSDGRKLQPGQASGLEPLNEKQYSCKEFVERLKLDRPYLQDTDVHTPCNCNDYKIGLLLDNEGPDKDYHFLRQDTNGFWSHKPGEEPATNLDAAGNIILDPLTADWDYKSKYGAYNYKEVCGFFCTPAQHDVAQKVKLVTANMVSSPEKI